MAIGVDTSKWKPRKIKGTPASKFRNYLGIGVLSFGIVCGLLCQFTSVTKNLRNKFNILYEDPIEEVERRLMIASGLPNRRAETIHKLLEKYDRPDNPAK